MPTIKIQNSDGQEKRVIADSVAGFALTGTHLNAEIIVSPENRKAFFEGILLYMYNQDVRATGEAIVSLMKLTKGAL